MYKKLVFSLSSVLAISLCFSSFNSNSWWLSTADNRIGLPGEDVPAGMLDQIFASAPCTGGTPPAGRCVSDQCKGTAGPADCGAAGCPGNTTCGSCTGADQTCGANNAEDPTICCTNPNFAHCCTVKDKCTLRSGSCPCEGGNGTPTSVGSRSVC